MWGVKPDLACIAKGITNGYFPFGATMISEKIANAFEDNRDGFGSIGHGYTYSAHPVGAAAALAGQQAIMEESWPAETGPLHIRMGLHTGPAQLDRKARCARTHLFVGQLGVPRGYRHRRGGFLRLPRKGHIDRLV